VMVADPALAANGGESGQPVRSRAPAWQSPVFDFLFQSRRRLVVRFSCPSAQIVLDGVEVALAANGTSIEAQFGFLFEGFNLLWR
jgi:hypothetical protein